MTLPACRLLQDTLQHSAAHHPDKVALICDQERLTYSTLWNRSLRMAHALGESGVKRGDRVGIFFENSWQSAVSIYAVLLIDAVLVVINPQTKAEKLAYILNDCTAKVLLAHGHLQREFIPAIALAPSLNAVFVAGNLPEAADLRCASYEGALAAADSGGITARSISLDLCSLIYTSGSTGEPKGVMHTHQSMTFALGSLNGKIDKKQLAISSLLFPHLEETLA